MLQYQDESILFQKARYCFNSFQSISIHFNPFQSCTIPCTTVVLLSFWLFRMTNVLMTMALVNVLNVGSECFEMSRRTHATSSEVNFILAFGSKLY
jgi:hypothetical protein